MPTEQRKQNHRKCSTKTREGMKSLEVQFKKKKKDNEQTVANMEVINPNMSTIF